MIESRSGLGEASIAECEDVQPNELLRWNVHEVVTKSTGVVIVRDGATLMNCSRSHVKSRPNVDADVPVQMV